MLSFPLRFMEFLNVIFKNGQTFCVLTSTKSGLLPEWAQYLRKTMLYFISAVWEHDSKVWES